MTKNEKRVAKLAASLPQLDECLLIDLSQHCNEQLWGGNVNQNADGSYYWENDISFSQQVDEYQVYRRYGIAVREDFTYTINGEEHKGMDEYYDEHYNEIEDCEPTFEIEWCSKFGQIWLNTITGEVVCLTRTDDGNNVDIDLPLHISNSQYFGQGYLQVEQYDLISGAVADESHQDLTIHPILSKFGYEQFNPYEYFDTQAECRNYGKCVVEEWRASLKHVAHVVARRHGYEQAGSELWNQYMDVLMEIGKDIRNPKYICPTDLQAEYDKVKDIYERKQLVVREQQERAARMMMERMAREDMEQVAETIAEDGEQNKAYQSHMGKYMSLSIEGGGYVMQPLHSVKEFYEEGTSMNHCVFRMGYYKKFTSLILSVKDKQGNRVATIELNLNTMEISQCYAAYDEVPSKDSEIRKILNSNIEQIKKLYRLAA